MMKAKTNVSINAANVMSLLFAFAYLPSLI